MAKTEIILGEGGSVGGIDLIWKNPSPYTAFSAQTIGPSTSGWVSGKDIADYDAVIVGVYEYAGQSSSRDSALCYIPKDSSGITNLSTNHINNVESHNSASQARTITFESNGVTITAPNASYNVPHYLWGVKGTLADS